MAKNYSAFLLLCCSILKVCTGVVYTHWGHQTCGTDERVETVYTGYVGGRRGLESGSGANYLCLPADPTYGNFDNVLYNRARIHGAEYENSGEGGNFPFDVPEQTPLTDRNALCAVCRVVNASNVLMIPARTGCYPGWTTEYSGYLVAEKFDSVSTEYICLDASPEFLSGGEGNDDAVHLYSVQGVCGSLPCPPYEESGELACAVCTM